MLPGKKYTPDDLIRIARRRIWVLLLPVALVSAATAFGSRLLPDRYRAETTILVVPQRVPESYVKSTVTTRIEDRLQSIAQQILSRTRLERIIHDFNLYAAERRTGVMEDIVERMRRDISVAVVKGDAFRVTYTGSAPEVVMKVTQRLASLFIEENLRDREVLAEGTSQFLEAQLDDARARLIEQEKKLEAYRRKFSGQLPSQLDSNLQVLHNTELQIQSLLESINRDRDRRLVAERMLADLTTPAPARAPEADGDDAAASDRPAGTAAQQLEAARARFRAMEARFKPGHPDMVAARRIISELEQKAALEGLEPRPTAAAAAPAAADTTQDRRVAELRAEIDRLDSEIARGQEHEQQLRLLTADYRQRVEAVPSRESEMAELTRDYTTLQSLYTNLLAKKEESIIAANLERRQIGEQFKLLDPAQLPQRPFSPNRPVIGLAGVAAGLFLGLALVAALEYRDATFRTDDEAARLLALPILATISTMQSPAERRRALGRRAALVCTGGATVIACAAAAAYTLFR